MYKVTIEKTIGKITSKTTIETDDVELVKTILEVQEVTSVHSDVDNLNINPEWQELMQWYKKLKQQKEINVESDEKTKDAIEDFIKQCKKRQTTTIDPYVSPFSPPYDPSNPFTVTC